VASSRTIIVAGAGIGGLTVSLTLANAGFRVIVMEQAERLEETGAGIQLSPNASRILVSLGLGERIADSAVTPEAIEIGAANGKSLARIPLGEKAAQRYGAPYWAIHRADLQSILRDAAESHPDIELKLGTKAEDFVTHANGVTVAAQRNFRAVDERGIALIGADGLWSPMRARLGYREQPEFRNRTAWRALIPVAQAPEPFRRPTTRLWLGRNAHLVHYPVKSGTLVNIVAIVSDNEGKPGWNESGKSNEILSYYDERQWAEPILALLSAPERWSKWSLYDLPPLGRWSDGPVTLLGDAAHPMLPFLAQGAAMAIEDAAVLAAHLAQTPDDPARAMEHYERVRRPRTAKVQHAARSNAKVYHLGMGAIARDLVLRMTGGNRLLKSYDWLYDWKPAGPQ
jgi:salicylate hydroxylase